jgi:hypothetical protein
MGQQENKLLKEPQICEYAVFLEVSYTYIACLAILAYGKGLQCIEETQQGPA